MRTFVAIEIPSEIRHKIQALISSYKSKIKEMRWTRPEGLHITLKFLGEISPTQVDGIQAQLADVHLAAPLTVRIQGGGCFPNERSPRVLWLGVESNGALETLAGKVDASLQSLGFAREGQPFAAHITLGRLHAPGDRAAIQQLLNECRRLTFEAFTANEFFLYESKLSSGGSVYLKVARFVIAANDVADNSE